MILPILLEERIYSFLVLFVYEFAVVVSYSRVVHYGLYVHVHVG